MAELRATTEQRLNGISGYQETFRGHIAAAQTAAAVAAETSGKALRGVEQALLDAADAKKNTTPTRFSYIQLAGFMLGAAVTCGGLVWALSTMLAERPTVDYMDQRIDTVRTQIDRTTEEVRAVRDEQTSQRTQVQEFRARITQDLADIKESLRPRQPR